MIRFIASRSCIEKKDSNEINFLLYKMFAFLFIPLKFMNTFTLVVHKIFYANYFLSLKQKGLTIKIDHLSNPVCFQRDLVENTGSSF